MFVGLIIRLLFLIVGADIYYHGEKYIMGDTAGWTLSFINLIEHGHYTFDLSNPDAYYARVPGYSFFWGLHYLIFGDEYVYPAVAVSQVLLDTVCIYLIYKISISIFNKTNIAHFTSLLYATYPFIILWTTISYSEVLSNFLSILFIYVLYTKKEGNYKFILLGLITGYAFLTREFLGILLFVGLIFVIINNSYGWYSKSTITKCSLIALGFLVVYLPWPIRNYVNHNQIILSRSMNGFKLYNNDFISFRSWINCFDNDETPYVRQLVNTQKPLNLPTGIFQNNAEKLKADSLIQLARNCGSSFYYWQKKTNPNHKKPSDFCNTDISDGFNQLRKSYIKNNFLNYISHVPLLNIKKAIFKNNLQSGSKFGNLSGLLVQGLFGLRSILIVLGLLGIIYSYKNLKLFPITFYIFAIYFFLCFVYRQLEIRNLVQVDLLLLLPASNLLFVIFNKVKQVKK